MAENSKIEWTDATWNPIRARRRDNGKVGSHCEHASEGCRNCYAETFNLRGLPNHGTKLPYKPGHRADVDIFVDEKMLLEPLRWRKPRMIFVGSMTDPFADFVTDAMLDWIFAVMALCPQHTFQVLTKRPARMRAYMATPDRKRTIAGSVMCISEGLALQAGSHSARIKLDHFSACFKGAGPFPNVWLGTSCEDQATADARVPELLATPAAVRFVSAEPLLGPIDFETAWHGESALEAECWGDCAWCDNGRPPLHNCQQGKGDWEKGRSGLDWIIVGGESGAHARPMHPAWARSIRDQCAAAGVSFHFKQCGAWAWLDGNDGEWPIDADGFIRMREDGTRGADGWPFQRVGKKHAGRLLDGVEHNGMPPIAALTFTVERTDAGVTG